MLNIINGLYDLLIDCEKSYYDFLFFIDCFFYR